jgi:putative tryptophan/tyrosine transport system substrate-binding protein
MSRRQAGGVLGAILLAASPLSIAAAAAGRVWRIGWLDLSPLPSDPKGSVIQQQFREGMSELGYVDGRDYVIEARFADTNFARLPQLARELVEARVDIIVTVGTPTSIAAKKATATIPIIMTGSQNPIGRGLIASFNRPGGNVTGLTLSPGPQFIEKELQLLRDTAPNITRVAVLAAISPDMVAPPSIGEGLGIALLRYNLAEIESVEHLNALFRRIAEDHCDAAFVGLEFVVSKYVDEIGELITKARIPMIVQTKALIENGALLYYYTDTLALRRRAAVFVDKVIKGANPGDLPVEQPSKFEFIVNLKTARSLGLTVPPEIVAFADQVIE